MIFILSIPAAAFTSITAAGGVPKTASRGDTGAAEIPATDGAAEAWEAST